MYIVIRYHAFNIFHEESESMNLSFYAYWSLSSSTHSLNQSMNPVNNDTLHYCSTVELCDSELLASNMSYWRHVTMCSENELEFKLNERTLSKVEQWSSRVWTVTWPFSDRKYSLQSVLRYLTVHSAPVWRGTAWRLMTAVNVQWAIVAHCIVCFNYTGQHWQFGLIKPAGAAWRAIVRTCVCICDYDNGSAI